MDFRLKVTDSMKKKFPNISENYIFCKNSEDITHFVATKNGENVLLSIEDLEDSNINQLNRFNLLVQIKKDIESTNIKMVETKDQIIVLKNDKEISAINLKKGKFSNRLVFDYNSKSLNESFSIENDHLNFYIKFGEEKFEILSLNPNIREELKILNKNEGFGREKIIDKIFQLEFESDCNLIKEYILNFLHKLI